MLQLIFSILIHPYYGTFLFVVTTLILQNWIEKCEKKSRIRNEQLCQKGKLIKKEQFYDVYYKKDSVEPDVPFEYFWDKLGGWLFFILIIFILLTVIGVIRVGLILFGG